MKYLKITLISVAIVAVGGFAYKLYSPDTDDIEKAVLIIKGTAKSMGITVENT